MTDRLRRLRVWAGLLALAVVAALVPAVASAAPGDPCESAYKAPMNSTEKLRAYLDCRLDRLDSGLKPGPTVTVTAPAPTVTVTPSVSPTPSSTPTVSSSASSTPSASPSPSPTPTGTPNPAGCVGAANTPGGPDPWGGCWPGPHNTGYPKGLPGDTRTPVTLTPYTGSYTIRQCGIVIDGKLLNQDLLIEAGLPDKDLSKPCVTIRNSLVRGVIFAESRDYGPVLIEDTEVNPDGLSWWENIGRSNFTAVRVNSHGSQGVIKCDTNCVARDNWVYGMELGKEYHYNAFGGNGTSNYRIEHNWASCGDWSAVEAGVGNAGCSSAIGFYGDFAKNRDITITRNMLVSNTSHSVPDDIHKQAAYCLNPGYYPGKPYPDTENIKVVDNVFARGTTGKCGVYGPANSLNKAGSPNGNEWADNRYTDGAPIGRPEE